jgi:sialidase-1
MSSRPSLLHAVFNPDGTRYHTFRIPALLAIPADDDQNVVLLAFCEGRIESAGDSGPIELVLRRSLDQGRTWEELQVVCAAAEKTCGNPVPILDPASGDVVLVSTQNGARLRETELATGLADAEDARRVYVQRSSDQGLSWSEPVEITEDVKLPDWGWYATGPCHGLAIAHGERRGRLVVPANHSRIPATAVEEDQLPPLNGGQAIISDDGGHTWRLGFVDENDEQVVNANETTVAELADGRLVFNARNHKAASGSHRVQAISLDGGETLTAPYAQRPEISAPQIQASMISPDGRRLLLSTPAAPDRREDLSIYVSEDAGHWQVGPLIYSGPSGYSDLAVLPDDRIAILFEAGTETPRDEIKFDVWTLADVTAASLERTQS